ncbi:MAG: response regulator transcription factor [Chthoniobacter sp.]|nr:response regulator transcription factor [Chthoniobacter sp.]
MNQTDSTSEKTRVLVVDDHPIPRSGIVQIINRERDFTVTAEAENADDGLAAIHKELPDLVLADLSLGIGKKSGLEMIRDMKAFAPTLKILVLSMSDEEHYAERSIRAGASGYVMKVEPGQKLIAAMRRVRAGHTAVSDKVFAKIVHGFGSIPAGTGRGYMESLSDREMEVFQLLGSGSATSGIATRLGIGKKTVEAHRTNIKAKLRIRTAPELIAYAARWVAAEGDSRPAPPTDEPE